MDKRKILRARYRHMKPEMGVFALRNKKTGQCYVEWSNQLKHAMELLRMRLEMGEFTQIPQLQQDWKQFGSSHFSFEVIRQCRYSIDEGKTNYTRELQALKAECMELLRKKGYTFY